MRAARRCLRVSVLVPLGSILISMDTVLFPFQLQTEPTREELIGSTSIHARDAPVPMTGHCSPRICCNPVYVLIRECDPCLWRKQRARNQRSICPRTDLRPLARSHTTNPTLQDKKLLRKIILTLLFLLSFLDRFVYLFSRLNIYLTLIQHK